MSFVGRVTIEKLDVYKPVPDINRVRVYRNLHKDCWSVKDFDRSSPTYNRVVAHTKEVYLEEASFIVSQAGCQKVRSEGRKTVHAFIEARPVVTAGKMSIRAIGGKVTYNPYKNTQFVNEDSEPVFKADFVAMKYPEVTICRIRGNLVA